MTTQVKSSVCPHLACPSLSVSTRYRYYVLTMLWLVALFRFVDLQILAVLFEPIKHEYQFSDTQLALLGGLAFALFYGTLGIPIAWLADRYNRRNIIASAVGVWSLMTTLCGFATGFSSLFLARMGVGIGEAGAYPPTTSLLADYFPPQQRGRAFAILGSAIPLGVFVGFLVGGLVNEYYGWRTAFKVVGIPGVLLAIVVHLTVRELPRGFSEAIPLKQEYEATNEPLRTTFSILWHKKSYRFLVIAACLLTLGAVGSGLWVPSYFIRHHHFSSSEIGLWLACLYGGGGLIGTISGGALAQYWLKNNNDYCCYLKLCGYSLLCILPLAPFVFIGSNTILALCMLFFICILMHMNIGPVLTLVQLLAGNKRRAMAQAINVLITNLIALPIGPLLVGLGSDLLTPYWGTQTLGMVILMVLISSYSASAYFFYRSSITLTKDLCINGNEPIMNKTTTRAL